MDSTEKLKERLRDEFGITTLEELQKAYESHKPVDLGIFVKGEDKRDEGF